MSYVVLARKWRPQSFADLVGQEHVSATLNNAIAQNRVAHAFLFTGVRGVGKTTSARILAKALNCVTGPTATPCQKCAPCTEITIGSDVDVQEIDGASYTGVDDVRRLQESLPYRPARDRFKIIIVDEVHMLSVNAWNAFLKTLEEPPPHVKFIFATTEVHKVPDTILSRCQRFDFKMLSAQALATHLRHVLDGEGLSADDGAIVTLAREAAGSVRDAMSLLDQVIAWVGNGEVRLTAESVARVLGVADSVVQHRLACALVAGDAGECVRIVGELAEQGYDLPHVARDILRHLRDLVVAKVCPEPGGLLDLADAEVADLKSLAARADTDDLLRLHQGFSRSFDDVVRSGQPRAALEMTLVRLARRPALLPIDELLRRLGELERRLRSDGGAREPPQTPPGHVGGAREPPQTPRGAALPRSAMPRQDGSAGLEGGAASTPFPPRAAPNPVGAGTAGTETARTAQAPETSRAPAPPARPPPAGPPPAAQPSPSGAPAQPAEATAPFSSPKRISDAAPASAPAQPASPSSVAPAGGPDLAVWKQVVETLRARKPSLASVLEHAAVLELGPERVVLGYEEGSFLAAQVSDSASIELIRSAVRAHFGRETELVFDGASSRAGAVTVAQVATAERKARTEAARQVVASHPLVTAAIELLGAELRDVKLPPEAR